MFFLKLCDVDGIRRLLLVLSLKHWNNNVVLATELAKQGQYALHNVFVFFKNFD